MSCNLKRRRRRRSARLKKCDNLQPKLYSITISLKDGECSFREIKDEETLSGDNKKVSIKRWLRRRFKRGVIY